MEALACVLTVFYYSLMVWVNGIINGFRIKIWTLCGVWDNVEVMKVFGCFDLVVWMLIWFYVIGLLVTGCRLIGWRQKKVTGRRYIWGLGSSEFLYIYLRARDSSRLPKNSIYRFMHIYTARNSQIWDFKGCQ